MKYSISSQIVANNNATVLALLKSKTVEPEGTFSFHRRAQSLGKGSQFRAAMNQINGLITAHHWESTHSDRFDGGPFDPAARDQLMTLACCKDNASAPELEAAASDRASRAWTAMSRGPKKAVGSSMALCDLTRGGFMMAVNTGEGFKSLKLEFERAVSWLESRGLTVDNLAELHELLRYVSQAETVVILDEVLL